MSKSEGRNPWPKRVFVASVFTLIFGLLIARETLESMPAEGQVLWLIAIFGFGLLIAMGNDAIDSWGRRLRGKSKGDNHNK